MSSSVARAKRQAGGVRSAQTLGLTIGTLCPGEASNFIPQLMALHLLADLQANADRFVQSARIEKVVWGLKSTSGWAYCPSNAADTDVILFWSDRAYAQRHAKEEWSDYEICPIPLDSFIDNWLRGMHEDGLLAGVNFNSDLAGIEIQPVELARLLTSEA